MVNCASFFFLLEQTMQVFNSFQEMEAGQTGTQSTMGVFNATPNGSWQDIREDLIDRGLTFGGANEFLAIWFPEYVESGEGTATSADYYDTGWEDDEEF